MRRMGIGVALLAGAALAGDRALERAREEAAALERELQEVIAACAPAVAAIENLRVEVDVATGEVTAIVRARGSGVVVTPEGRLITNVHVVEEADALAVRLPGGGPYDARLVADAGAGEDSRGDVALLELYGDGPFPHADWRRGGTRTITKGSFVFALGNPDGLARDGRPAASLGIVAGEERAASLLGYRYLSVIRHDAALNPGNSGGPLFDIDGNLVGINGLIYTRGEEGHAGIGFAIPMDQVRDFFPQLMDERDVGYGYLGLQVQESPFLEEGLQVVGAAPGSPAAEAGLEAGDVLVRVGASAVRTLADFHNAAGRLPVGERLALHVRKLGRARTSRLVARLARPPEAAERGRETAPRARRLRGWLGVHWELRLGRPRVTRVLPGTGAARAGLRAGDEITGWDDTAKGDAKSLLNVLSRREAGDAIRLHVRRDGRRTDVETELDPLMRVARVLQ